MIRFDASASPKRHTQRNRRVRPAIASLRGNRVRVLRLGNWPHGGAFVDNTLNKERGAILAQYKEWELEKKRAKLKFALVEKTS